MKAALNAYLSNTPNSSLNIFRDLLVADLERKAGLELQKFSIDFNSLSDEHKTRFLMELDKALTNINIMRAMVADIKKEVQAEASREAYFEAQAIEKMKKEEEEAKERKLMESLGTAIEMAAVKTSTTINNMMIPGLDSMRAVDDLNEQFAKTSKVIDEQLIKVTEILLGKIKVVEDAESTVGDTGYMDEFGNMPKTGVLTHVLRLQTNVDILALQFGIHPREMHRLVVVGDRVIVPGIEDKFMTFAELYNLFETSTKENATMITPIMLSSVQGIDLANAKVKNEAQYLSKKIDALETGVAECTAWRVMVLQQRGIAVDNSRIEEQLTEVARNEPQSFVEKLVAERAAFVLLTRDLEESKAARKAHEKSPQVHRLNFLEELQQRRELRKTVTNDRSSVMLEMYRTNKTKFAETAPKSRPITPDEVNTPSESEGFSHMPTRH